MGDAHYLPQPALPEVPGRGGAAMAGRARGRAAAGAVLPRRLHAAGRDRRHRLPEQGRRLRPPVQGRGRDADSRSPPIPKHLGARIGITAVLHTWGSALTHHPHVHMHRARRRPLARRHALDRLQARLLPARAGALASVPPAVPRRCSRPLHDGRPAAVLRRPRPARRQEPPSTPRLAPLRRTEWVVYAKRPFAGPKAGARLSRPLHPPRRHLQPPAHRARRRAASPSAGRTIGSKAATGYKTMTLAAARVHPPLPAPRAAERLPPHPPLRPLRQRGARGQHRARPTTARRGRECAPAFARGRQSG